MSGDIIKMYLYTFKLRLADRAWVQSLTRDAAVGGAAKVLHAAERTRHDRMSWQTKLKNSTRNESQMRMIRDDEHENANANANENENF